MVTTLAPVDRTVAEVAGGAARAGGEAAPLRRLRRMPAFGPRCPDCAGPLAFGEGCSLGPVCGYSGCAS